MIWKKGQRKLVIGSAVFVALIGYAFKSNADFTAFATAMIAWMGAMLTAHVTAEKLGAASTEVR